MNIVSVKRVAIAAAWLLLTCSAMGARVSGQRFDLNVLPLPLDRGAAGLWQSLEKLHTRASLIMIVAHPDDEDGGMLAYESRGRGARVVQLTLNRGEGGQNVMSVDDWDALGLVRTQELLTADDYDGVEPYFTRVADFGFSKTKEESLEKWGHDRVLADAVRVIRMTRPLVVTSVWVGGPSDGHGQHQVAGQIAQEVFKAAGDPHAFPEQIQEGLRPWSPLKMYARNPTLSISPRGMYDYATRRWVPIRFYDYVHQRWIEGRLSTSVEIPEGQYDPVLGISYRQLGAKGLGFQKSQNGGVGIPGPGPSPSPYHRFASLVPAAEPESSFFDGIDISLTGIADLAQGEDAEFLRRKLAEINSHVEAAMRQFTPRAPAAVAPELAAGLSGTRELIRQVATGRLSDEAKYNVNYELGVKQSQFNTAIVRALGLSMRAVAALAPAPRGRLTGAGEVPPTFQVAIPGQHFTVCVQVANPSSEPVTLQGISLVAPETEHWPIAPQHPVAAKLLRDAVAEPCFAVTVPPDAAFTRPYFTRPSIEQPYYDILDGRDVTLPFTPYPLAAAVDLVYRGVPVHMGQVVQTSRHVNGFGEVLNPLVVAPAISVMMSPGAGAVPLHARSVRIAVRLHSNAKGPARGTVELKLPAGWRAEPRAAKFATLKDGDERILTFRLLPARLQPRRYAIRAVARYHGREYAEGYRTVGYPGLRPYFLYRPARYQATGVNLNLPAHLSVGYIAGTGDDVPPLLEGIGIPVHILTPQDLAGRDLAKYISIVVGIRAYSVRDDIKAYNGRLLDYVKGGGALIVQYQAPDYDYGFGPYPYRLSSNPEVVVDETSRVEILSPGHPLLTWPNKITPHDFDGWIEERGHGFMKSWDSHYQALLSTHDPDQDPQRGGLLYARYGNGIYIYVAYALYRQLPEGVPGAYRLMINLLSAAANPRQPRGPN